MDTVIQVGVRILIPVIILGIIILIYYCLTKILSCKVRKWISENIEVMFLIFVFLFVVVTICFHCGDFIMMFLGYQRMIR